MRRMSHGVGLAYVWSSPSASLCPSLSCRPSWPSDSSFPLACTQVPPQSASRPVRVAVARVDCPENTALCDTFGIRKYPTLYLDKPMAFGSLAADSQTKVEVDVKLRTKDKVLKRMGEIIGRSVEEAILPEGYIQRSSNGSDGSSGQDTVPQDTSLRPPSPSGDVAWPSTDCDVKGDVTIATIEMFEYLKSKTVLGTFAARKALMDWLGLLETSHLVEECAAGAGEALRVLEASWPVTSEQILDLDALKQVKICGKEQKRPYVSCAGSTPETRGYTCGLWMLFHSLSVRMPMVSEGGNDGKRWMEVLEGYIKHFFQCSDCAEHFLQELQGSDARMVSTKRDAVLWLWKTHNRVNERLVREDASGTNPQDPVYKHVQWPLEGVCGTCYESTGGWNEEGVLNFLSAHYYGLSDQATNGAGETGKVTAAPSKASITWPRVFVIVAFVFLAVYHGLKSNSVQYGPIAGRRAYRSTKGR